MFHDQIQVKSIYSSTSNEYTGIEKNSGNIIIKGTRHGLGNCLLGNCLRNFIHGLQETTTSITVFA